MLNDKFIMVRIGFDLTCIVLTFIYRNFIFEEIRFNLEEISMKHILEHILEHGS